LMKYVCRAGANIYHPEIFYTSHHDTKTGSYDTTAKTSTLYKIIVILTVKDCKNATVQNVYWLTESFRTVYGK